MVEQAKVDLLGPVDDLVVDLVHAHYYWHYCYYFSPNHLGFGFGFGCFHVDSGIIKILNIINKYKSRLTFYQPRTKLNKHIIHLLCCHVDYCQNLVVPSVDLVDRFVDFDSVGRPFDLLALPYQQLDFCANLNWPESLNGNLELNQEQKLQIFVIFKFFCSIVLCCFYLHTKQIMQWNNENFR